MEKEIDVSDIPSFHLNLTININVTRDQTKPKNDSRNSSNYWPTKQKIADRTQNITSENSQETNTDVLHQFLNHIKNPKDYFQMTGIPKGKVIIINNGFYGGEYRKGSAKDVDNLTEAFRFLGGTPNVDILTLPNLASRTIPEVLKTFCDSTPRPSFYVVVIMSHGTGERRKDGGLDDMILGVDGTLVNVEDVVNIFKKDHFMEIPKLLFFQMCRGEKLGNAEFKGVADMTAGVETSDAASFHIEANRYQSDLRQSHRNHLLTLLPGCKLIGLIEEGQDQAHSLPSSIQRSNVETVDKPAPEHVSDSQNLLISFSTTEDYISPRNTATGSWFIETLCAELKENANKHDIIEIMEEVHRVVHGRKSTAEGYRNCVIACDTAHTLEKKLLFFPGM